MTQNESTNQEESEQPQRTMAEWITFGIASLLLATIVGLIGYLWLTEKQYPPVLSVDIREPIREANNQYYVPFEVTHLGGETVASVQVIAELRINGEVQEAGEQEIEFLTSAEKKTGAFVFRQNPRRGQLILRIASYQLP